MKKTSETKNGLYAKFRDFSNADIDEAISALSEERREFLLKYHNGNFNNKVSRKKMDKEEQRQYQNIMVFIKRRLENTTSFYSKFDGFTKEEVDEAILALCDDKEIEILKKYHNGNLEKPIVAKSLTAEEKYRYGRLVINIHNKLNRIRPMEDLKTTKKLNKIDTQKRKTTKSVDSELDITEKENDIAKNVNNKEQNHMEILNEEKLQVNNKDKENSQINTKKETDLVEQTKDNVRNSNRITKDNYINLLELLKSPTFETMTKNLSTKEAVVISLAFGHVDGKYFDTEAISNFLQIDQIEVINIVKNTLINYKEGLNNLFDKAITEISNKTR